MKRVLLATITAAVCAIGGCGGDRDPITAREFTDCISDQSVLSFSTSEEDLDLVAADAGDGGVYVDFGKNSANVAVERSNGDADSTEKTYEVFAQGFDLDVDDLLHRSGNVVWLYEKSPTEEEASAIEACVE